MEGSFTCGITACHADNPAEGCLRVETAARPGPFLKWGRGVDSDNLRPPHKQPHPQHASAIPTSKTCISPSAPPSRNHPPSGTGLTNRCAARPPCSRLPPYLSPNSSQTSWKQARFCPREVQAVLRSPHFRFPLAAGRILPVPRRVSGGARAAPGGQPLNCSQAGGGRGKLCCHVGPWDNLWAEFIGMNLGARIVVGIAKGREDAAWNGCKERGPPY